MKTRMYLRNLFYLGLFALIVIGCRDGSKDEAKKNREAVEEVEVIDVEEDSTS